MIFGAVIICTSVQGSGERGTSNDEWSWRGSIPDAQRLREHPTSPGRNVKSRTLLHRCRSEQQREVN